MFHRLLLASTIVMFAACCCAQIAFENQGSAFGLSSHITGVVRDMGDRPLNGARVELLDGATGRNVATSYSLPNGTFEVDNLRHGTYEIVASVGLSETRNRIDLDGDREVTVRIPVNREAPAGASSSVSLSQMKVPGKARRMLDKAFEAFHRAKIDEAYSLVQKALGEYPDYAKALTLRGILNMQKGDTKDAQPDLEKAVQLDYGDDTGFVALAALYNNEGEFGRAQQTLDHGMTLSPKSWQANMEMARAQIGIKNFGGAIRSLDRAQSFAPPEITLLHLFRAQAFVGMNDTSSAIKELQAYLEKSPTGDNSNQARRLLAFLNSTDPAANK